MSKPTNRWFTSLLLLLTGVIGHADDPKPAPDRLDQERSTATQTDARADGGEQPAPEFVLTDDVRDVLVPLFSSIASADVTRATVEMLADSLISGRVVESSKSTYHIASARPNKYTVYLKEPEQRTRIYCDGKNMTVAVAPDAYLELPEPLTTQDAVTSLPLPLGPYVEPVLALTLAGADPAISLIGGMKSIVIVDRDRFRDKVPAIHLKGVQADAVTWDLWITAGAKPKPIRLLVDLTPMLIASDQVQVPDGFSYQVRFDFLAWRVTGKVDPSLFVYSPPEGATQYESLQEYYNSVAGMMEDHPLLGKPAPRFLTATVAGERFDSDQLRGKVVVLDFWATWCQPCLVSLPILKDITNAYEDKDVVLVPLNTGEDQEKVAEFLQQHELGIDPPLDPEGRVADAFVADALPQTVVIGKDGVIESVHVGFLDEPALRQRLTDELNILSAGGKIATANSETE